MRFVILSIVCFWIWSKSNNSYAQNYARLFTVNSGLPSNKIYDCVFADDGKMWVATDKGLVKYNGYTFTSITLNNGLTTKESWGFFKDSRGRIWLMNRQIPFTYIYKDSIYQIGGEIKGSTHFDYAYEDTKGNVYIVSSGIKKTHCITTKGKVLVYDEIILNINSAGDKITPQTFKSPLVYNRIVRINDYLILLQSNKVVKWNTLTNSISSVDISFLTNPNTLKYINDNSVLIKGDNNSFIYHLSSNTISPINQMYSAKFRNVVNLRLDQYGNRWLCDLEKGLWFEKSLAKGVRYFDYGDSVQITGFFQDSKKDIFFSFDNGTTKQLSNTSKTIKSGPYFNQVFNTQKSSVRYVGKFQKTDFWVSNNGYLYILNNKSNQLTNNNELICNIVPNSNNKLFIGVPKCFKNNDSLIAVGTSIGTSIATKSENTNVLFYSWKNDYVFDLLIDDDNLYTVGLGGLNCINLKTKQLKVISANRNYNHIVLKDNYIIALKENGEIDYFDKVTHKLEKTKQSHLDLDNIQNVSNEIWGISNDKVVHFKSNDFTSFTSYSKIEGLTNPYKLGVIQQGNYYYIFCNNGIYQVQTTFQSALNDYDLINFYVSSINVDGNSQKGLGIKLQSESNSVNITVEGAYYPFSHDIITYYYSVNNGRWFSSSTPEITLLNLPYGDYKLAIKAKINDVNSFLPRIINIQINNPPPFHRTILFWILCLFLFTGITGYYFYRKRKNKEKYLIEQFENAQNKMKMLTMQMKPHFLSNIFNSLQNSFLENDSLKSSETIKNLNEYLRLSLINSEKDFIPIGEEIQLTQRYFNLEAKRISKPIKLIVSDQLKQKSNCIKVPTFILQPIIENAIWHGIMKGICIEGIVEIDFKEEDNYYAITVSDNGVGIGNSTQSNNSIALKNINARLSLIDGNKRKTYLSIEKRNTQGTKITLYVTRKIKNHSH